MAKITFADKETLNPQPSIARENKVIDLDVNEIKSVVNGNDDNVGTLSNLKTTVKTSIVGAINEMMDACVFTTTEVKTNMKIDNKDVYTITKEFSPMPSNTTSVLNPNISNLEQLYIDWNLSYFTWGGNRKYPNDNYTTKLTAWIDNDNKIEVISTRSDGSNWKFHAVLLYTKTS